MTGKLGLGQDSADTIIIELVQILAQRYWLDPEHKVSHSYICPPVRLISGCEQWSVERRARTENSGDQNQYITAGPVAPHRIYQLPAMLPVNVETYRRLLNKGRFSLHQILKLYTSFSDTIFYCEVCFDEWYESLWSVSSCVMTGEERTLSYQSGV